MVEKKGTGTMKAGTQQQRLVLLLSALAAAIPATAAETVRSPDGKVVVTVDVRDGTPLWNVAYCDHPILRDGLLGFETAPDSFREHLQRHARQPQSGAHATDSHVADSDCYRDGTERRSLDDHRSRELKHAVFLQANAPLFDCHDTGIEPTYHSRWSTFRILH
jgi:hypothetical protein